MSQFILAVDDEEGFRALYRRILEPAGYEVRTAADSNEALRIIKEEPPAVAILDIRMPGPSGLWLADQIRNAAPGTAMILATSDAAVPASASLKPGIVAYLVKPFDSKTLRDTVTEALNWWASAGGHPVPVPMAPAVPRSQPPAYTAQPQVAYAAPAPPYTGAPPGWSTERRLLWALVILLTLALIAGVVWYLTSGRQGSVLSRVSAASGVVRVRNPAGKVVTQGSGFFVAPDLFATAHHVVRTGVGATIEGPRQVTFRVDGVVGLSLEHDLALLKTTPPSPAHLAIAESPPAVGDPVAVYGAPLGLAGTLSTGIISSLSDSTRFQISAPISPGSSGSPVVDGDGAVVGVAIASMTAGQALNFAIPASALRGLLSGAGPVRPFATVARGAGDDRERHELVGPVRMASVTTDQHDAGLSPVSAVSGAVGTVRLSFDQLGRLIEREDSTNGTVSYLTHGDRGRLKTEVVRQASRPDVTWEFADAGTNRIRAVDVGTGTVRLIEYSEDGRVASEVTRLGVDTLQERQWAYDTPAWPGIARSAVVSGAVQLDALGNPTTERLPGGGELRYRYTFDAYGNWLIREVTEHVGGQSLPVRVDRRSIEYWD